MKRLRRLSLLTWLLLRSIPPVPPGRLLMPALFLSVWTVLRAFPAREVAGRPRIDRDRPAFGLRTSAGG